MTCKYDEYIDDFDCWKCAIHQGYGGKCQSDVDCYSEEDESITSFKCRVCSFACEDAVGTLITAAEAIIEAYRSTSITSNHVAGLVLALKTLKER